VTFRTNFIEKVFNKKQQDLIAAGFVTVLKLAKTGRITFNEKLQEIVIIHNFIDLITIVS
jgi:hypothetical protein